MPSHPNGGSVEYSDIDASLIRRLPAARRTSLLARLDDAVFFALIGGLAWVPFWYGSNVPEAWGANAMLFPGLAIAHELSIAARGGRHPVGLRALAAPAALFAAVVLWIVFQIAVWVPGTLVNPIWGVATEALGQPLAASISVDRGLTMLALVRLLTAASVFWLAVQLCRDSARAHRLITAVAAIGAAYAVYGLVAMKGGQLRWLDISSTDGRLTSTFVNHNSYAAYAGVGFIAAAGLLIRQYQLGAVDGGSRRLRLASAIEVTGGSGAALLAAAFLSLTALLLTGSRGGVLATCAGILVLAVLAMQHRPHGRRRPVAAIAILVALTAAALLSFGALFAGNLGEHGLADDNRLAVLLLTLRSALDAPLLGFGYGTFRDVFTLYRDHSVSVAGIWGQAHDTYAEALQGLGLVFGAMLIGTLGLLALRCARGALTRRADATVPRVAAAVACLLGVHSTADFSLQIQAVALTFMAVLGAGVAQATSSRVDIGD